MGASWGRHYYTVIFILFFAITFSMGAATNAHAWRASCAEAEKQPDYPGIKAHFIDRVTKDGGVITMYYPETGNAVIDRKIVSIINKQLDGFEKSTEGYVPDKYYEERGVDSTPTISSNYIIHEPSPTSLAVEFTFCESYGKAFCHKHCLNFSRVDGRLLALEDMFDNAQTALKLMSDWTRRTLPKAVPGTWSDKSRVNEATSPTRENFYHLLITSEGLRIIFDIGKLGPMSTGDPELTMPIAKLAKAGPKTEVWGHVEGTRQTGAKDAQKTTAAASAPAAPESAPTPAATAQQRQNDTTTPLPTPLLEKMQVSPNQATFLIPTSGKGLNFSCTDSGTSIERCIYISPEFVTHAENASSDYAFVQGQVTHGAAAEATYVWGQYRTGSGLRSTTPVFVCEKCKPDHIAIKKDTITFYKVQQSPFDTQTVNLKFRIVDGVLKKLN